MLRPATPADRAAVVGLVLTEDDAWARAAPVSVDEAGELVDAYGVGVVFERDGRLVGYAARGEGRKSLVLVDPATDPAPALTALVAWLAQRGGREIATYAGDLGRIGWLEAHGFTARRAVFDLVRGVDPGPAAAVWPAGVEIDQETAADEYRRWVARRAGEPVAWSASRVFVDGRGWIERLEVAPTAGSLGLERALLLHTLADLRDRGATSFALNVQGENAEAITLYRDAGFEIEREWRDFSR